jgi:hypothetical protein
VVRIAAMKPVTFATSWGANEDNTVSIIV